MKLRAFGLVLGGFGVLACNGGAGGGDGSLAEACAKRCSYEEEALKQVSRDLTDADQFASSIDGLQVKSDDDIKRVATQAAEECTLINMKMSHAQGILWAVDQERTIVDAERGHFMNELASLEGMKKATTKCDLSPAQMKSDIVAKTHGLKDLKFSSGTASCTKRCTANRAH
jgi:hypothetical protein